MPDLKGSIVPVTPFQQNCAILFEEQSKRGVVIDPGGEVPRILEAIGKLEVRIERILLTHGHIDHAALIRAIENKLLPLGDDLSFICGHGPGSTISAERRSNPFLRG